MSKLLATLLGVALATFAVAPALAGPPPPTPTQPAAPDNVQVSPDFTLLTWTDNSNNEDGFRVRVTLDSNQFEFFTGANTTSVFLPPEAVPQCPDDSSVIYDVFAFNKGGMSQPAALGIAVDCPPAAPSDAQLSGGVLSWTDNSDNENGFHITIELSGFSGITTVLKYEVGTNAESFPLPPEAQPSCPDAATVSATVAAFNAFGESDGTGAGLSLLCTAPTPTVVASVLPQTGAGDPGDGGHAVEALLAAGAALTALGVLAWRLGRQREA